MSADITTYLERVKTKCEATDFEAAQLVAQVALRILVQTRVELCANAEDVGGEELRAFIFNDNSGMWAKAEAALEAMDAA
jgi:hypothetical protein